jgi:hypothetical protein
MLLRRPGGTTARPRWHRLRLRWLRGLRRLLCLCPLRGELLLNRLRRLLCLLLCLDCLLLRLLRLRGLLLRRLQPLLRGLRRMLSRIRGLALVLLRLLQEALFVLTCTLDVVRSARDGMGCTLRALRYVLASLLARAGDEHRGE